MRLPHPAPRHGEHVREVLHGALVPFGDRFEELSADPGAAAVPVLPVGRYRLVLTDRRLLVQRLPWGRRRPRLVAAPELADVVAARTERWGLGHLLYVHLRPGYGTPTLVLTLDGPADGAAAERIAAAVAPAALEDPAGALAAPPPHVHGQRRDGGDGRDRRREHGRRGLVTAGGRRR